MYVQRSPEHVDDIRVHYLRFIVIETMATKSKAYVAKRSERAVFLFFCFKSKLSVGTNATLLTFCTTSVWKRKYPSRYSPVKRKIVVRELMTRPLLASISNPSACSLFSFIFFLLLRSLTPLSSVNFSSRSSCDWYSPWLPWSNGMFHHSSIF